MTGSIICRRFQEAQGGAGADWPPWWSRFVQHSRQHPHLLVDEDQLVWREKDQGSLQLQDHPGVLPLKAGQHHVGHRSIILQWWQRNKGYRRYSLFVSAIYATYTIVVSVDNRGCGCAEGTEKYLVLTIVTLTLVKVELYSADNWILCKLLPDLSLDQNRLDTYARQLMTEVSTKRQSVLVLKNGMK